MKLSPNWIRDFIDLSVEDLRLAEDLTNVGLGVEGIEGSGADTIFEMEIGTNRPDAMNHYGVAREAAAIYDLPLKPVLNAKATANGKGTASAVPSAATKREALAAEGNSAPAFPVIVEEPNLCPRFSAQLIHNTRIQPSPQKIAHRLQLLDQRPISNAVDATNYVLWEIGKPTHVYDMDLLEGGKIIVRKARKGETLKTLDGVERKLTTDDLVVCDAKKPVGLAGVMGGYDTMITDKTRNIVIESAWWDPATVRKMSRRHAIHTDASHRFERGADFESCPLSCELVAQMILASGGGELVGDVVDVVSKRMDQAPVVLHVSEVERILGGNLDAGQIFRLLKRLGFVLIPEGQADAQFRVQIPSWRLDVEREIDLIEEVARLHGYDKFENTLPAYSGAVRELPHAKVDAAFRDRALALGYNEALSVTFISHADAEKFGADAKVLELENPLSEEASVMRTSLVPGMLGMLAWNLNRDVPGARLFEMGSVYQMSGTERVEPKRACLGATAAAVRASLPAKGNLDVSKGEQAAAVEAFRGFKGDVENLLAAFAGEVIYERTTAEYLHPVRSAQASVNGSVIAQFGQIHPEVATARKLRQEIFLAEFDLDAICRLGLHPVRFTPLAKYPAVERDFSFVFDDRVTFEQIKKAVEAGRSPELQEFLPVEIFRGGSIPAGKYSILLRARFQSTERTLHDEEIAGWSAKIVASLTSLGGTQRA
ncbi:MAG TPA: phenylalanine--tRNA ligase subunit beta [Candidatus Sulfotelmatobacter sp.]|jgi:phenylalanyl-tRNA synthetase beta chain|nr:phenylalanine--tRNA ligase subunit beta [Candidatus Sulfotelmatobacter sp.]